MSAKVDQIATAERSELEHTLQNIISETPDRAQCIQSLISVMKETKRRYDIAEESNRASAVEHRQSAKSHETRSVLERLAAVRLSMERKECSKDPTLSMTLIDGENAYRTKEEISKEEASRATRIAEEAERRCTNCKHASAMIEQEIMGIRNNGVATASGIAALFEAFAFATRFSGTRRATILVGLFVILPIGGALLCLGG